MADDSVSYFSSFINRQIQSQEQVESYLWKLEALMNVATMTDSFCELPENILQHYFSIATDLIEKAEKANQTSMHELFMEK